VKINVRTIIRIICFFTRYSQYDS